MELSCLEIILIFVDLEELGDRECDQFGFYRSVRFIKLEKQKAQSNRRRDKRRVKKWTKMEADFDRALRKKLTSRIYKVSSFSIFGRFTFR